MKTLLSSLLLAAIACGQQATNLSLPAHWAGSIAGYSADSAPRLTPSISYAYLLSSSAQVYSFSTYDVIMMAKKLPTFSLRTGVATPIRQFAVGKNDVTILGIATGGVAQGQTSVTGAFSGGGLGLLRFKNTGFTLGLEVRFVKAAAISSKVYGFVLGRAW
jgi:hypothetical protein